MGPGKSKRRGRRRWGAMSAIETMADFGESFSRAAGGGCRKKSKTLETGVRRLHRESAGVENAEHDPTADFAASAAPIRIRPPVGRASQRSAPGRQRRPSCDWAPCLARSSLNCRRPFTARTRSRRLACRQHPRECAVQLDSAPGCPPGARYQFRLPEPLHHNALQFVL